MNICVIGGAGYVGLITGVGLSCIGHSVVNVDVDEHRIAQLQRGELAVYEYGTEMLLKRSLAAGSIRFSTDCLKSVDESDVVFITVGTPAEANGQADLSQVLEVVEQINYPFDSYKLIVVKSTIPVGAMDDIRKILSKNNSEGFHFDLVVNPEFLREGKAAADFLYPKRIVVGANSDFAKRIMIDLYKPIIEGNISWENPDAEFIHEGMVPVVETTLPAAQMIKYVSNAFLATRISFINEIAGICEMVGADVNEVVYGAGFDSRIGHEYFSPGIGFGGPCLEKDLKSLIGVAENKGYKPGILQSVLDRNDLQIWEVIRKLKEMLGGSVDGKRIAIYGLTFKAETDDIRNSPSLRLIDLLLDLGATVDAFDPAIIPESSDTNVPLTYYSDPYKAVEGSHGLAIVTDWSYFRTLDYEKIRDLMAARNIVDGRNILNPCDIKALGFDFAGVGRS